MGHEPWPKLAAALAAVAHSFVESSRNYLHPTATIVRVHLWAASHDRPVSWACQARNWGSPRRSSGRPKLLPDQSTVSRRVNHEVPGGGGPNDFERFLSLVGEELQRTGRLGDASPSPSPSPSPAPLVAVRRVDGKPLEVAAHSRDRDAAWGRGAGGKRRGYKLHAIWRAADVMPEQFAVCPLNACEKLVARRLVLRLGRSAACGAGYLLGDAGYDDKKLFDLSLRMANHQLLCPRQHPGAGLGHRRRSPGRLRSIAMLEVPGQASSFGRDLYAQRRGIETDLGNLTGFGGGLTTGLPAWVRRPWRVRAWVHAKLLVNAARILALRAARAARAAPLLA